MALFETTRSQFGGPSLLGRLSASLSALVSGVQAWNDSRVTRSALSQLTDRELDDIGLHRGSIDEVSHRLSR